MSSELFGVYFHEFCSVQGLTKIFNNCLYFFLICRPGKESRDKLPEDYESLRVIAAKQNYFYYLNAFN